MRPVIAFRSFILMVLVVAMTTTGLRAQTPLGSGFTYQGLVNLQGNPLSDTADFEFRLWNAQAGGSRIGSMSPANGVSVTDGLFTVELDFGVEVFSGESRWLEIGVRSPAGAGAFTTLSPRQALTAVPYSLQTRGIYCDIAGNVGIGTSSPNLPLDVRSNGTDAIQGTATGGSGVRGSSDFVGVMGLSDGGGPGAGVYGLSMVASGESYGVFGGAVSPDGYGVYGTAEAATGTNYGVYGKTNSSEGYAGYFEGRVASTGMIESTSGGFKFPNGNVQTEASPWQTNSHGVYYTGGNVGIGMEALDYVSLVVSGNTLISGTLRVVNVPYGDYGNAQYDIYNGKFYFDNSSRRYKENIAALVDDFDVLLDAVPRTYTRPDDPDRWEIGYIAEEFAELGLDRLMYFDEDGAPFGVNYSKLPLFLTQIVKGHRARLEAKDTEIAGLKARFDTKDAEIAMLQEHNSDLESRLAQLETLVAQLAARQGEN